MSRPIIWKHFPSAFGNCAWQQYFMKGYSPIMNFLATSSILSLKPQTSIPFYSICSHNTLKHCLLPFPKAPSLTTNFQWFLLREQLVRWMQGLLRFYLVGIWYSSAQNLANPSQFKQQRQGDNEVTSTQSLKSNFLPQMSNGLSMQGWTTNYWLQIDEGISLSLLIIVIPSPCDPADGLAMNIFPLFRSFSNSPTSSGMRYVLGQNQYYSGQYSTNLFKIYPIVFLWQMCFISGNLFSLISEAMPMSSYPMASPDHMTSPYLNTSVHLGWDLMICLRSLNSPRDLDVLIFRVFLDTRGEQVQYLDLGVCCIFSWSSGYQCI